MVRATSFWPTFRGQKSPGQQRSTFETLVQEVLATPEVGLYDAIEAGVPTYMVDVIAAATGESAADVMEFGHVARPEAFVRAFRYLNG